MVRARGTRNGTPVAIFGLSAENIKRLQKGKDIEFDGTPFGLEGLVVITYGPSEIAIAAKLGVPLPTQ